MFYEYKGRTNTASNVPRILFRIRHFFTIKSEYSKYVKKETTKKENTYIGSPQKKLNMKIESEFSDSFAGKPQRTLTGEFPDGVPETGSKYTFPGQRKGNGQGRTLLRPQKRRTTPS